MDILSPYNVERIIFLASRGANGESASPQTRLTHEKAILWRPDVTLKAYDPQKLGVSYKITIAGRAAEKQLVHWQWFLAPGPWSSLVMIRAS